ncbi:MAG TPA: polysaccharide biosynthesis protein [Nitrospiraceae bacterium]|nr:polysaccharide biosynthesis protein [Nitrospiraceae bacterium]
MSRIEQALEKAIKMRESMAGGDTGDMLTAMPHKPAQTEFEAGEVRVDLKGIDRHIVSLTDPYSQGAEEYRKLRVRLLRATQKNFLNTIMVTSSGVGEGKSITAINLAVSIANEIDHTVLLVDGDLRRPSLHRYLGIEPSLGLSDYLMGKTALSNALVRTGVGKLVLLPAGTPPQNPSELLSSERMKETVRELKNRYKDRYVIFDSSPVLATADTLSLSNYMDGIIFVVQASETSPRDAQRALSLIKGRPVLGAVFNNVPPYLAKSHQRYSYQYAGKAKPEKSNGGSGEHDEP